jgi:hypothetical protein
VTTATLNLVDGSLTVDQHNEKRASDKGSAAQEKATRVALEEEKKAVECETTACVNVRFLF